MLHCLTSSSRYLSRYLTTIRTPTSPNPRAVPQPWPNGARKFTSATHDLTKPSLRSRGIRGVDGRVVNIRGTLHGQRYKLRVRDRIRLGSQSRGKGVPMRFRRGRLVTYKIPQSRPSPQGRSLAIPPNKAHGKAPARQKYVWLGGWTRTTANYTPEQLLNFESDHSFNFDKEWTTKFHEVSHGRSVNLDLELRYRKIEPIIQKLASYSTSLNATHRLWTKLPWRGEPGIGSIILWQDVMLWCLHNAPARALRLLVATFKGRRIRPPRHVALDCLHHLSKHFMLYVKNPDPSAILSIYHLTLKFIEGCDNNARVQSIPDQVIYLLLKHMEHDNRIRLIGALSNNNVQLHGNTLLQLLDTSLDVGNVSLAMRLLGLIVKSGLDTQRKQVQSACVRVLRAHYDEENNYRIRSKILTQMLEMGVRPELPMQNAILLNAVEADDLNMALQMYDIARQNRLEPDHVTYGILLKGAMSIPDSHVRQRILDEIRTGAEKPLNIRLVSDLLHAISIQQNELEHDAFPEMLRFYKQHCDLRPLVELGLCDPSTTQSPQTNLSIQDNWPSSHILGQMLCAYIRSHSLSDNLIDTYTTYHTFTTQPHPLITPVAQTDHVPNAFLMAFGQRTSTLAHCTTIVKHMLDASHPHSPTPPPRPSPPSIRTWSLLASAYLKHKQPLAAEEVLAIMRKRGLQPDRVTWNTIVSGYAGMQEVERAVDAMKRMEAEGFEADRWTLRGLDRVWNRERLLSALERDVGGEGGGRRG